MKSVGLVLLVGALTISCSTAEEKPQDAPIAIDWEGELRLAAQQQRRALEDFDIDAGAMLMCEQYRDAYRESRESQLPTMASFATPEQTADSAFVAALPDRIKERYPETYAEDRLAVADAVARQDRVAFRAAAVNLMSRVFSVEDQVVDNINIEGGDQPEKATADVTTTTTLNGGAPETKTTHKSFVLQDSNWLDCTDPAQ